MTDSVCGVRGDAKHVCSMTNNQGKESKVEVTGVWYVSGCRGKSSRNSASLKSTCLEMYILWVWGQGRYNLWNKQGNQERYKEWILVGACGYYMV